MATVLEIVIPAAWLLLIIWVGYDIASLKSYMPDDKFPELDGAFGSPLVWMLIAAIFSVLALPAYLLFRLRYVQHLRGSQGA